MDKTKPLNPAQIAEILQSSCSILKAMISALPVEVLSWHFDPKEWSIKQVLGHLIETENKGFAKRVPLMVKNKDPQLVPLNRDDEALIRDDCAQDTISLLNEFISVREKSCVIVSSLNEIDLGRGGWHPDAGYLTVKDLVNEWIYHDMDHIRQITDVIQRYIWDHMGIIQDWYKH
jgi:hypothetical protein